MGAYAAMDLDQFCRRLEQSLHLEPNSIQPDTAFGDIPEFDSMSQIEVILLVDEMYDVQIPEETIPHLKTIRDVGKLVQESGAASSR